jgi:hypothetical protein
MQFFGKNTPTGVAAGTKYVMNFFINEASVYSFNPTAGQIPGANDFLTFCADSQAGSPSAGGAYIGQWTLCWNRY